jgi:hypothetical protein
MTFRFEWEEGWENKAFHFRSSLNPLGDAVREATDAIGARARAIAQQEAARWTDTRDTTKGTLKKNFRTEKLRFYRAKAMAYSLNAYVSTLKNIMVRDGDANYGAVVSYHARGAEIEFGGKDPKLELGKTGEYLEYPAFGFLRRALGGGG